MDQHSRGGHQALERGNIRAWVADGEQGGERYVALFNLGESCEELQIKIDLGLNSSTAYAICGGMNFASREA